MSDEAPLPTISAEGITAIVESKGPIVECVILRADGSIEQKTVDMTPKMKKVHAIIGGEVTFLGQFHAEKEVEGVILVARRGAEEDGSPLSKQVIQPPFNKEKIYGDVLLMRTDEGGTPVDFSKEEYEKFAARTDVEEIEIPEDDEEEEVDSEDYDSHEDDEEVEGESDSEEEEEGPGLLEMLMPMILQKFQAENGRAPEPHELEAIQAAMLQKLGQAPTEAGMETIQEGDDEEDEEDEEEEEKEETKENVVIKANSKVTESKKRTSSSKRVSLETTSTTTTSSFSSSSKKARVN